MSHVLKNYSPKYDRYVTLKNNLVDNANKFYEGREKIIEGFKNGVFQFQLLWWRSWGTNGVWKRRRRRRKTKKITKKTQQKLI